MSRSGRGWGPFSGGQLTVMVCVIVAAVAFPVAASAVTASKVFVTDATSGKTAKVSTAGAVSVAGSVTSKLQGSTSGNKAEISPDEQLLVTEAAASTDYTSQAVVGLSSLAVLSDVPVGDAVIVKQLHVNVYSATGADPYFSIYVGTTSSCATGPEVEFLDVPSGVNSVNDLPFDPGLVIPAADQLCMAATSAAADVTAVGYVLHGADAAAAIHGVRSAHKETIRP